MEQRLEVRTTRARGHGDRRFARAQQHGTEPVAAAGGEEPDGGGGVDREVTLLAVRGAEVEAGRLVDEQPRFELTVGDRLSHMRYLHASCHVPIDAPSVITRLVLTSLAEL